MRALKLVSEKTLSIEEVPDPVPQAGEALVRVAACGVCGTDLHGFLGHDKRRIPPLILGHEAAGEVVKGSQVGRRVVINPIITCMQCEACLDDRPQHCGSLQSVSLPPRAGAFADLVSVPENNLYDVPDNMSFATAAIIEPTAVACHAARRAVTLTERHPSKLNTLVIGGGPIGLLSALVLKARGAKSVTLVEPNSARRRHAEMSGIEAVLESTADVRPLSVDLVIDAVGSASTRQAACDATTRGGVVMHLGLIPGGDGLDAKLLTMREIVFTGSYCYSRADFSDAVQLLAENKLGELRWVGYSPMSDGSKVFDDLTRGDSEFTKVVLQN